MITLHIRILPIIRTALLMCSLSCLYILIQSVKYQEQLGGDIELHVHVLTTGYWPPYTQAEINMPKQVLQY